MSATITGCHHYSAESRQTSETSFIPPKPLNQARCCCIFLLQRNHRSADHRPHRPSHVRVQHNTETTLQRRVRVGPQLQTTSSHNAGSSRVEIRHFTASVNTYASCEARKRVLTTLKLETGLQSTQVARLQSRAATSSNLEVTTLTLNSWEGKTSNYRLR